MSSIDNRIVQMEFNNRQFESGISTSIKSLESLNKSLKLEGATKGLSELEKSTSRFNLSGIGSAVDTIAGQFSTMGIVGVTALANITNSAVNAGKRLVSSLTIDPIKMGFSEYETKMNAIQTILTNTAHAGTSLEDVTAVIDELNTYADKTIYNFSEMTRNIGTFTAAGIGLEESAIAIQGIANLAAGSGSNAQQASTAMYQLSQALSSGTVKLQDWNSVVNAGMGGKLFQDALTATAEKLGQGRDMSVSFRDSLQDGWLTTEVLMATLTDFANDESLLKAATQVKTFTQLLDTMKESVQSGWGKTWELIIGDKEQAAELFTAISDGFNAIVGPAADARNEMLEFWNENEGRDAVIDGLSSAMKGLGSILKPIGEAFREVFPATTGQQLVDISKKFQSMMSKFKMSEKTLADLKSTFKGLFSILDGGVYIIKEIAGGFLDIVKSVLPAGEGILSITGKIGDFITKSVDAMKQSGVITSIMDAISSGAQAIIKIFSGLIDSIKKFSEGFWSMFKKDPSEDVNTFVKAFEPIKSVTGFFDTLFDAISNGADNIGPILSDFASKVGDTLGKVADWIVRVFSKDGSLMTVITGGAFVSILLAVKNFISGFAGIGENLGDIAESFSDAFSGISGSIEAFQNNMKADTLIKIATAIGILAVSLFVLSKIEPEQMKSALAGITVLFVELFGAIAIFEKIVSTGGLASTMKVSISMIALSTAVLILSGAVSKLANLDWDQLNVGLGGVAMLIGMLAVASKAISTNNKGLISTAIGLVIFSSAIRILTKAVERLSELKPEGLAKGLIGVGVLMGEIALFMQLTSGVKGGIGKSIGILILANAMVILSKAVEKIGSLDLKVIGKGLMGIGALLLEIGVFLKLLGKPSKVISTAIGITILGGAIHIMASAISKLGNMQPDVIGRGLMAMGGALGIIAVALRLMPKGIFMQATSLVILASALVIMSHALENMGAIQWEELKIGMLALGGSLAILALGLNLMKGTLGGAAAIFVAATALAILTPVLKSLGKMSLKSLGMSLIALAGGFAIIGGASALLMPLAPAMLAVAGATFIFGIAMAAVGAGMLAFGAGMSALAISGAAGGVALVNILEGVIGLIPSAIKSLAEGLVTFIDTIASHGPKLVKSFVTIFTNIIDAVVECTPIILNALGIFIDEFSKFLLDSVPVLVDRGIDLVVGLINGIASKIPDVISSAVNLIAQFLIGISSQVGPIIDAAFQVIINFIDGLASAISNNTTAIYNAVRNLINSIVNAVAQLMPTITQIGIDIIRGMIQGVKDAASNLVNAAMDVVRGAVDGVKNFLGIHSPSRLFMEIGNFSMEGLANGITEMGSVVEKSAVGVGSDAVDALSGAMASVSDIINGDIANDPVIKPVVDLTNVQNGARQISSMMGGHDYGIGMNTNNAKQAAKGMSKKNNTVDSPINNQTTNSSTVYNTFNITGNNPKDIANEVSRIIQKQVERRDLVWGR